MPYVIRPRDGKFIVKKRFGKHVFGTHDTKQQAQAQIKAIYWSESQRDKK